MKKIMPLAASIALILIAGIFASAASFAYFSNKDPSTSTFTAGTLSIKLYGGIWKDTVGGTWTMSNMAPGDKVTGVLYIRNDGSLPIKALLCDLDVIAETDGASDGKHLDDYLYVSRWQAGYGPNRATITWGTVHTDGRLIRVYAGTLEGSCGDSDDLLPFIAGGISQIDPGKVVALWYEFEFKNIGNQNNAQGDSVTMRYTVEARSNPC